MLYSTARNRWEIVRSFTNETLAFMNETTPEVPIGNHKWYYTQYECTDNSSVTYRTLNFHKYVKQPGNFCCNDGTCFTSEFVCDGTYQCDSQEDELDCTMIEIPKHYGKFGPPPEVFLNLTIVDILDINEQELTRVAPNTSVLWYSRIVGTEE